MSIELDIYLGPKAGRSLTPEEFVGVAAGLIEEDLVVPPYRVFQGRKETARGLADALRREGRGRLTSKDFTTPSDLTDYFPPTFGELPRGIKIAHGGSDGAAFLAALRACDFGRSVFAHLDALKWGSTTVKKRGEKLPSYSYLAAVLLVWSPEELAFEDDYDYVRTQAWWPKRTGRRPVAFHQCAAFAGYLGPRLEEIRGSPVEAFFRKRFGSPLQAVLLYS
jgi:hypothetical protein